jgi:hypothetical protein
VPSANGPAAVERRTERIGRNEALFRDVNERVVELAATAPDPNLIGVLCECGEKDCVSEVRMSLAEYERLRQDPTRFVVIHGHEKPSVEGVVESTESYHVIKKDPGTPREVARETDPRS